MVHGGYTTIGRWEAGIQTGMTNIKWKRSKQNELANQKTNIRMLINQITKKKQGQDKSKQTRKFSANPDPRRRPLKAQRYNRLNNSQKGR